MAFATNTNFSSAVNPIDVGQPTKVVPPDLLNGFKPEAAIAAEHVNYCFHRLCPRVERFLSSGTWTQQPGDRIVQIVLVGGGAGGLGGAAGLGGAGGQAGEVVDAIWDAGDLASSLTITIGNGGTGTTSNTNTSFCAGQDSQIVSAGFAIMLALGGYSATFSNITPQGAGAGSGGTAAPGVNGVHSRRAPGGSGGAVNVVGGAGRGFGGGGGGGRQLSGSSAGGGGGGGGYGTNGLAGTGSTSTGGPGANGVCIITTWRDIT